MRKKEIKQKGERKLYLKNDVIGLKEHERIKDLQCLYAISEIIENKNVPREIYEEIIDVIPSAFMYPHITEIRLTIESEIFKTKNFIETPWKLSKDINYINKKIGVLEIFYKEERPESFEGPFLEEEKKLINIIGNKIEKTIKRIKDEETLRKNEKTARTLLNIPSEAIFLIDTDFNIVDLNKTLAERFGKTIDEMKGINANETGPPDVIEKRKRLCQDIIKSGEAIHFEDYRDGIWLNNIIHPIFNSEGKIIQLAISSRDITWQKLAEQKMAWLASFPESNPNPLLEIDMEGNVHYINPAGKELLGDIKKVDYLHQWFEGLQFITDSFLRNENKSVEKETKINGIHYKQIFYYIKEYNHIRISGIDITKKHETELALKIKNNAIPSSINPIVFADIKGKLTYVNKAFLDMWGYENENEIIGKHVSELWLEKEKSKEVLQTLIARGSWIGERRGLKKDGSIFYVQFSGNKILDDSGNLLCLMASFIDITERKKAEDYRLKLEADMQYIQKQKSLGIMAGGIAHDFNNILMIILANAEMCLSDNLYSPEGQENINNIIEATKRAAKLSEQMLIYSGKIPFKRQKINLQDIINEMLPIIKSSISKKIELKLELPFQIPSIESNTLHLNQIIMNLVINASEAIGEEKGTITISAGVIPYDRKLLEDAHLTIEKPEEQYVFMEITDTGCGMDKETCSKIFDPFFTTKFTGRGLGMASVFGIIRAHKGIIKVKSELNIGTTVTVLFPPLQETEVHYKKEKNPLSDKGKTLLLVDDEEQLRSITEAFLKKKGFKIITSNNGEDALKVLHKNKDEISCILLDLLMPVMTGEETITKIYQIKHDIPVIILSGYNEETVMERFKGKYISGFIQKPYSLKVLLEKLKEILY